MNMRRTLPILVALIAVVAAFLVGTIATRQNAGLATSPPTAAAIAPAPAEVTPVALTAADKRKVPDGEEQIQLSFAPVVKAVTPSVVNVYATTVTQPSGLMIDPFFQQFFGGGRSLQPRPRASQSLGSGVIIDASGVILTNSHVVHGATDVRIATNDGQEYAVDVVLDDAKTDLAVLKVRDPNGRTFPALGFGNSDDLQVGDLVLAIGNPFGVGQTVTSGIVSALARTGVESNNYEFFIQTDAAINPGNSGGALVDLTGKLVGVNTAIFSQSGGSVGIGFAIPSNMAKTVAEAGISGGAIVRPWFGVRTQEVTPDIANSLGLDRPRGALVTDVAPGGPAERAGFRSGDVLLSVDDFNIDRPSAFDFRLATEPVGTSVKIGYLRNGTQETAEVKLEAPPAAEHPTAKVEGNTRFSGTTVETITPAVAEDLGLNFNAKGVVVTAVEPGSPADQMGLQTGDIILSLNGRDTTDAQAFSDVAKGRPQAWQIELRRGDREFRTVVSG